MSKQDSGFNRFSQRIRELKENTTSKSVDERDTEEQSLGYKSVFEKGIPSGQIT